MFIKNLGSTKKPSMKRHITTSFILPVVIILILIVTLWRLKDFDWRNPETGTNDKNHFNYVPEVAMIRPSGSQWTVMMLRIQPLSDYWKKPFSAYISGFGTPGNDYWLGLFNIYNMVQSEDYKLRIEIQLQDDRKWYAVEYSSFAIVPEHSGGSYMLSVGGLSGDTHELGDPLLATVTSQLASYSSNGMLFSAFDYVSPTSVNHHCAEKNGGGWWFGDCCNFCPTCNQFDRYRCSQYPLWMATRLLIKSVS